MARSRAEPRPAAGSALPGIAVLLGAATLAGTGLAAAGAEPAWARLALAGAGLALLAWIVALNGLLRLQGLDGEGLPAAAGVLGAAVILLSRAVSVLLGTLAGPQGSLFGVLELAGFLMIASWVGPSGWSLRRLLAPAPLTGGIGLAAAAAAALLAALAFFQGRAGGGEGALLRALPFVPVAVWAVAVAGLALFGRPAVVEPPE